MHDTRDFNTNLPASFLFWRVVTLLFFYLHLSDFLKIYLFDYIVVQILLIPYIFIYISWFYFVIKVFVILMTKISQTWVSLIFSSGSIDFFHIRQVFSQIQFQWSTVPYLLIGVIPCQINQAARHDHLRFW